MKTIIDIVLEKQIAIEKEIRKIEEKCKENDKSIIYLIIAIALHLGLTIFILWR